jgi:hypothetical protein
MSNPLTPELIDPQTKEPQFVVWLWVKLCLVAIANVIILGLFAAYFKGQPLGILDIVGIIADSSGIITGLLGIWFFFLSERLNRSTTLNMERTTATVEDLRVQMWGMIQKTFTRFLEGENKDTIEKTKQDIENLRQQLDQQNITPSQLQQALEMLIKRIETIERQNRDISFVQGSSMRNRKIDTAIDEDEDEDESLANMRQDKYLKMFPPGLLIEHEAFGSGKVIRAERTQDDVIIHVQFENYKATKRLIVSLAISSIKLTPQTSDNISMNITPKTDDENGNIKL